MKKVAFFDFCETLVNFQTADAFVDFVRTKTKRHSMVVLEKVHKFMRKLRVIAVLEKLTGGRRSINKRLKLLQLRGFSRMEIDNYAKAYYEERLKPNFIAPLIDELKRLQRDNWEIVIVSGGYDVYLKLFVEEFGVQNLISTKIKFKGKKCLGEMDGSDCLYENKTKALNQLYDRDTLQSVSFSDSMSDLPFLSWTNEGVVVSRLTHKDWVDDYKFKEIIWT